MASVDTVNASSSSSSSSSLPFNNVFLSFRGSETRQNFTDLIISLIEPASELLMATEESRFAVVVLSREYASSTWCLAELAKIGVLPIFHYVDPHDVRNQRGAFADALTTVANTAGWVLNYGDPASQSITNIVESLSNGMPEDGSTNWNSPPRYDVTPDESDDDADEMVQDNVADLPLIGQENESLPNLSNGQVQLITNFVESLSIGMPEDGSTNWNSPPRFDVTPDESDDADEMVQDNVADLPLIGLENESLYNLSNSEVQLIHEFIESLSNWMPEDGSTNWNLPPRYDVTPDESDDDADEMVQDNVADLPLEAHVVLDDVADVPQEAHVVEDHAANLPQEAHVVEDHVANLQQECIICVDNAEGMTFQCEHKTCVECGERLDRCPICREPIISRNRF